jgi:hypothetical protein
MTEHIAFEIEGLLLAAQIAETSTKTHNLGVPIVVLRAFWLPTVPLSSIFD